MLLRGCSHCRRHVDVGEIKCPFCDVTLAGSSTSRPVAAAGRLGRAAVFAGATIAGTACWTDAKTPTTTPIEHKQVDGTPATPPPGTIRGVIRSSETGEPLPGLSLTIRINDSEPIYATSNQAGEYEFTKLPPGEYTIEYERGDRQPPQGIKVKLGADAGTLADVRVLLPQPDRGPCCKPYGAPPARRRVV
jgi:hypothetical protein